MVAKRYDGLNGKVERGVDDEVPFDVYRSVAMRTERPFWALAVVALCLLAAPAAGLSIYIDASPRPAILLRKSDRFIVISAWNSVGLYSLKDGKLLREFPVGEHLDGPGQMDPGEQFLVNVNRNGTISLWEIDSGKKLWSKRPFPEEKRLYALVMSFSADGGRLLILGDKKFFVYETRSGNIIGEINRGYGAGWTGILSPDGSQVLLSKEQSGEVQLIDVTTGVMKRLDVGGGRVLQYTTDGKFAAFIDGRSGAPRWELRVVSMDDAREVKQVGVFESWKVVRPVPGGSFLILGKGIIATPERSGEWPLRDRTKSLLFRYDPATGKVKMMDGVALPYGVAYPGDFDLERMVGITTYSELVTRVIDLRTGKDLLIIDNRRDAKPPYSELSQWEPEWRPGHPVLLTKSDQFIALKDWDRAGLYGLKDGKLLREFSIEETTYRPGVVDPRERFLVNWSKLGRTISLWEIDSGRKLWSKRPFPSAPHCCPTGRLSFSADGGRLLIVGPDRSVIRETASGKPTRELIHEYSTYGWRGALSPDGSKVMLSDAWKQQSYLIDVSTGEMKKLNVGGGAHVRYSTDGRFVAFFYYPADDKLRGERVGSAGFKKFLNRHHGLRVVSMDDAHEVREVGVFEDIRRIKALARGGFLISGKGIIGKDDDFLADTYARLGAPGLLDLMKRILFTYHPSTNEVEVIGGLDFDGDFDLERAVGVTTDRNLATRVVNLRTGRDLLRVDNWGDPDDDPYASQRHSSSPHPMILLKSDRFIALKARDSVGLYSLTDGSLLREFTIGAYVGRAADVDAEEQLLVSSSFRPTSISLWEIDSGKRLWTKRPLPEGEHVQSVRFSANGNRILVTSRKKSIVYETRSGSVVSEIDHKYGTGGLRGSLSPDGSQAIFSDAFFRPQSYLVAVSTGAMTRLHPSNGTSLRYSTDGRFVAFFDRFGGDDRLRVISMDDTDQVKDVGLFEQIGRIRAVPGGSFLISAKGIIGRGDKSAPDIYARLAEDGSSESMKPILFKYHPSTGKVETIEAVAFHGDFDPERMVGVTTDIRLVTRVVDLRTGKVLLTVGNLKAAGPLLKLHNSRNAGPPR